MNAIYKCEDFKVNTRGVLVIYGAELVGMAQDVDDFNKVYEYFCKGKALIPNAIICPTLYCQQRGIKLVVFEQS